MHAVAVIAEDRLGHECHCLRIAVRDVLYDVLKQQHLVGRTDERIEFQVDFRLSCTGNLMMMAFHFKAATLHDQNHLRAKILIVIGGRNGEISLFVARAIAEIVRFPSRIPAALFGVDVIKPVLLALIESDIVEDEELRFGAKVRCLGDAGGSQIHFGLACDVTGIAIIALLRDRIDDVANHHQGWHLGKWIKKMELGVRLQQHVALVNPRPRPNGRSVNPKASLKRLLSQSRNRIRNVMPQSRDVGEAEVENLGIVPFRANSSTDLGLAIGSFVRDVGTEVLPNNVDQERPTDD